MNDSTKLSHLWNPQISINSSRPSSPRIWSRSAAAVQEEERTQCAPRRKRGTFQFPCCSFLPRFYPEPRSTLLCRRLNAILESGDGGWFSSLSLFWFQLEGKEMIIRAGARRSWKRREIEKGRRRHYDILFQSLTFNWRASHSVASVWIHLFFNQPREAEADFCRLSSQAFTYNPEYEVPLFYHLNPLSFPLFRKSSNLSDILYPTIQHRLSCPPPPNPLGDMTSQGSGSEVYYRKTLPRHFGFLCDTILLQSHPEVPTYQHCLKPSRLDFRAGPSFHHH